MSCAKVFVELIGRWGTKGRECRGRYSVLYVGDGLWVGKALCFSGFGWGGFLGKTKNGNCEKA
jgi:hypothetical protein